MGIAIYPAFSPPVPEAQIGSDGKLLAKYLKALEELARIAGVPSLGSFMDRREPDLEDDLDEFIGSWDEWFPVSEGIRAVEGVLSLARGPSRRALLKGEAAYLPKQLEDLLRCLRLAKGRGARFRIELIM
jgi:hypothetical protein